MTIVDRFKKKFNIFAKRNSDDRLARYYENFGPSFGSRPNRVRFGYSNERTIIASIYTRLAIDISVLDIRHIRKDQNGRYKENMKSPLNECLMLEANIDQTSTAFFRDVAMTVFNDGVAAIVPVDLSDDPDDTGSYDIYSMQVARVVEWYPRHVKVNVYDDLTGLREDLILSKSKVAIVENPLYSVMNEPNSTLKRLTRKLTLLDTADEAAGSGKLDLIIQLPYVIKSEARQKQAEDRKNQIEMQLSGSKYGIAYTDGTEKITQLNRPAENNLMSQIEYLTEMLYGELGLTVDIFNGKATEEVMLNYHNRTIDPLIREITTAMTRTFLTKAGRTQGQAIQYFRDPFKLVPISQFAEIVDKLSRNEVITGNEARGFIGLTPSSDPKAEQLMNSNMPDRSYLQNPQEPLDGEIIEDEEDDEISSTLDSANEAVSEMIAEMEDLLSDG